MANTNSNLKWPVDSPLGYRTDSRSETPRAKKRVALREAGVEVITNSPGKPAHSTYAPQYAPDGSRNYPDGQYSPDGLAELGESDISAKEYERRRKSLRRVYEAVPATPMIIDFSEVKQPLHPQKTGPWHKFSSHPQRELYRAALQLAKEVYPDHRDRFKRDIVLWERMGKGELPEDFNPYKPGTDHHEAFAHKVLLLDDRPYDDGIQALMTERQVRRRAERKLKRGLPLTDEEFELIFKPVEQWTMEELSRGYPRTLDGKWPSQPPSQLMRGAIREKIEERFRTVIRQDMSGLTVEAITQIRHILKNDDVDGRGRPAVPASVKMKAAEFLIDHLVGKPKQVVETDISVKLAGILGDVMIAPEAQLTTHGVVPTGRYSAGQRGVRGDFQDDPMLALSELMGDRLSIESYVDAEVVDEGVEG